MEVKVLAVFLMVTQMSSASTTRVCRPEPVDIVFVLDESGSVGRVHFGLQLNFIADFVDSFTIGRHAAQIALVTFSTNPVAEFHLNAFSDKDNLKKQIHNVTYSHPGLTRTATALEYVRNICVRSENGYRINASHIIIVMTDGRSMDSNKTINEARILQSMGFSMFAIGISSSVDPTEINKIASDINKTAIVSTFTDLGSIRNQIVTSTCEDIAKLTQTIATSKERITTNKPSQRTTTSRRTHTVTNANTMLSKITKATTLHTHLKTTKARTVPTMTTKTTSLPTKITKASTLPTKATKTTNLLFKITKATTFPTKTTKSTTLTTKVTQTSMLPTKITKGTTLPTTNTKTTNIQAKTTAPNLPTKTTTTTTLPTKTTTTTTLPTKMTTALPTKTTTTLPTKTTTTTTLPTKTTTTTTLPTKIINGSPSPKPVHSVSNNGQSNSQGSPSTVVHGHAKNQNSSAVSLVTAIPSLATNPGHSISTTQVTQNVLQNNTNSGSGHFINHITNNNSNNPQNNVVTISQTTSKPNTHLNFNLVNSSNLNSAPTGATLPSTHPNFMVNILTTKRSTMYSHFTILSHTSVNNNSKNGSGMTNTSSVFSSKNNSTSTNNAGSGSAGHVTSNVHSNNTSIVNTLIGYVPSGTSTNNVSNVANNSSKTGSGSTVVIAPSAHSRTTVIHNPVVFSNTSTGSGLSMSTNSSSLLNTSTVYHAKPGSGPAVPVNSNNAVHNNVVQGHASLTAIPNVYVNRPGQTNAKPASASVVSGNYPAVNKWGTRTVTGSASAITTPVNSNNVITKSLTTPRGPPNIHQNSGSMIYHGASSANNIGTTRPTRNYFGNSNSFSNNKTPPYGANTGTTNTGKSGNGANQIPVGSVQSHNAFNPVSVLSGVNHQSGTGNIGNNNTSRVLPGNRSKGYSNEKTAHFPHWFEYLEISIVSVISLVALGFLGCCINILCLMCCRKNKRSKAEKGSWKFGRLLPMSKPKERLFD